MKWILELLLFIALPFLGLKLMGAVVTRRDAEVWLRQPDGSELHSKGLDVSHPFFGGLRVRTPDGRAGDDLPRGRAGDGEVSPPPVHLAERAHDRGDLCGRAGRVARDRVTRPTGPLGTSEPEAFLKQSGNPRRRGTPASRVFCRVGRLKYHGRLWRPGKNPCQDDLCRFNKLNFLVTIVQVNHA
jgi:hypothetical protein